MPRLYLNRAAAEQALQQVAICVWHCSLKEHGSAVAALASVTLVSRLTKSSLIFVVASWRWAYAEARCTSDTRSALSVSPL